MNDLLIIIPAYNEEKNIGLVLDRLDPIRIFADIVVIDDGSTDKTLEIIINKKCKFVSLPFNTGYGKALQTGFKYASEYNYKYIITFDGDGQHNVDDVEKIYNSLKLNEYDLVIGSRYTRKDSIKTGPFKKIGIKFLRYSFYAFTGKKVYDPTSGFKGLNKRIYKFYSNCDFFSSDYPDTDILIQTIWAGFKINEIEVSSQNRLYGESMHSGIKPIYYFVKFILNTTVILLSKLLRKEK